MNKRSNKELAISNMERSKYNQQAISKKRGYSSNSVLLTSYSKLLVVFVLLTSYFILPTPASAFTISKPFSNNLGLVGHWTFDGKDMPNGRVNDISGQGNHGSLVNMSTSTAYAPGKIGQGLRFDGVNDRIQTTTQLPASGSFTVSMWIKKSTASGNITTFSQDVSGNIQFFYSNANNGFGYLNTFNATDSVTGWTYTLDLNWHHVTIVEPYAGDVDGASFYVDGVLITSQWGGLNADPPAGNFSIGGHSGDILMWNGSIDDVRIYNRALSESEIKTIYSQGAGTFAKTATNSLTDGLVGHWTFDGKDMLTGRANDISGQGNHGSLVNMSSTTAYTQGRTGQALKFDGINDYVVTASATGIGAAPLTVAGWVKLTISSDHYIFSEIGNCVDNLDSGFSFLISSGKPSFDIHNSISYDSVTSPSVNDGKWHHVVAVLNNALQVTFFVDGRQYDTFGGLNNLVGAAACPATISGSRGLAGYPTTITTTASSMDEIRVYNRALSANEIQQLYNMGVPQMNVTSESPRGNGLIGHWTFDGKDMLTGRADDVSGQGHHGSLVNMSTSTAYVQGKIGQGVKFDAVNDKIDLGSTDFIGTGPFSLSVWIKPTKAGGRILSTGAMNFQLISGGRVSFGGFNSSFSCYTLSAWTHIVLTRDAAGIANIYCNAGNFASNQDSGTPTGATENLTLGNRVSGVEPLGAVLDDVRMYNRVLSLEEVKVLYNMGR